LDPICRIGFNLQIGPRRSSTSACRIARPFFTPAFEKIQPAFPISFVNSFSHEHAPWKITADLSRPEKMWKNEAGAMPT
jgi:hypothetical protein